MSQHQFGDRVLVVARTARVIGSASGYRQAIPPRDAGRLVAEEMAADCWPGVALPEEWVAGPPHYDLEPAASNGTSFVRLRRVVLAVPMSGVVVGATTKQEGTLRPGQGGAANDLAGPGRRVSLYEVAVAPRRRGDGGMTKAQLVLAHPMDLDSLVPGVRT